MAEEIKVPIGVPVETNAAAAADSIESFRDVITDANGEIKAMQGTLRQLRGTSDDVKAAKAQLTAKIDALKGSVSAASLALVKQGTSYDAAAAKEKKLLEQTKKLEAEKQKAAEAAKKDAEGLAKKKIDALSGAFSKAGGPIGALKGKIEALKDTFGESSSASSILAVGVGALVAAVAAFTVAVAAGVVSLAKWVLTSADAARNANLLREAWSGTAENAGRLGDQVDLLASKVPTSKAALNELAISLMKNKIGGQATVDALNAVGQASAALGDEAGNKLKDFITRARMVGRVQINPMEMLEGFGNLDFKDVAGALAKNMKISVVDASKALAQGRVKLGDGAKAIRDAVEKRFGDINLRKMMSFEVMAEKLREKLASLTKDVKLEPLLKPMSELGKLFDGTTVTGQMLKKLVTEFGNGAVKALTAAIPLAKSFFQGMVIGSLTAYIAFLKLRNATKDIFDTKTLQGIDGAKLAIEGGTLAAYGLIAAVGVTAAVVGAAVAPFVLLAAAMTLPQKAGAAIVEYFKSVDWMEIGTAIPSGILAGVKAGASFLLDGMQTMAKDTKNVFAKAIGFASPAKAFKPAGKGIPQGVEAGVEQGKPDLNQTVSQMVDIPRGGSGGGSGVEVHVHVHGGGPGPSAAQIVQQPSFQAALAKAVDDLLISFGLPVQG